MRVQAQYVLKLGTYLRDSGIRPTWLAEQLGVHRVTLHGWLVGDAGVPEHQRVRILEVLRARQELPVDRDLFETEEGSA